MKTSRFVPADRMWCRIKEMPPGRRGSPGRTAADNRLFLEAVLRRAGTGSPWRDLPEEFGNWNSVFKRFRRRTTKGVFDMFFKALYESFDLEYAGVDGTVDQAHAKASGGKGGRRIAGGRRRPRDLLFMAAPAATRCDAEMAAFRARLGGKGKKHKVAIVAAAGKLAIVANALLREDRERKTRRPASF